MGVWRGLAWAPVGKGVGAARALATHGVEKVEGAYGGSSQISLADADGGEGRDPSGHHGWPSLSASPRLEPPASLGRNLNLGRRISASFAAPRILYEKDGSRSSRLKCTQAPRR